MRMTTPSLSFPEVKTTRIHGGGENQTEECSGLSRLSDGA